MPGVTIGENSIVGAFSLVNSDIPDNAVAVGVPAKVIRSMTGSQKSEGRGQNRERTKEDAD